MTEEEDLLSRISQLAGQINIHKGRSSSQVSRHPQNGNQEARTPSAPIGTQRYAQRHNTALLEAGRIRKGYLRPYRSNTFRNKTLVLNKGRHDPQDEAGSQLARTESGRNDTQPSTTPTRLNGWVSKHDRHIQLINASVYERDANQRAQNIERTRQARTTQTDVHDTSRLSQSLRSKQDAPATNLHRNHTIDIDGISFAVCHNGSKLARIKDYDNSQRPTPKITTVGDIQFFRSKNGNLYRAAIVRTAKKRPSKKLAKPCKRFSTTGQCIYGPRCAYIHDPDRVGICRNYLKTGDCDRGGRCDLSHEPTPERVPICSHFLRGSCSRSDCRYAHVKVDPTADICRTFVSMGFCPQGALCDGRHIFECPDYSNAGTCRKAGCKLPHIDRAGQLRRKANLLAGGKQQDDLSDLSSDEDMTLVVHDDDIDSDDLEDQLPVGTAKNDDDDNDNNEPSVEDFLSL